METVIYAIVVYLVIFFLSRIIMSRDAEARTSLETAILVLMGVMGAVVILAHDHSLTNAVVGMATIALMHMITTYVAEKRR